MQAVAQESLLLKENGMNIISAVWMREGVGVMVRIILAFLLGLVVLVILSLLLIQEGQLSVSCDRMCTSTG